jgi:PhnB protein
MLSPEGEKHWCIIDFEVIKQSEFFSGIDAFCDESAVVNNTKPRVAWENGFAANENQTVVNIQLKLILLKTCRPLLKWDSKKDLRQAWKTLINIWKRSLNFINKTKQATWRELALT